MDAELQMAAREARSNGDAPLLESVGIDATAKHLDPWIGKHVVWLGLRYQYRGILTEVNYPVVVLEGARIVINHDDTVQLEKRIGRVVLSAQPEHCYLASEVPWAKNLPTD